MAVINKKERHQSRRSSFRNGAMVHTVEYLVETDDPKDGTAIAVTGVPAPGSPHDKDPTATLTGIEAAPHEQNEKLFLIQCEFTTTTFGVVQDPLSRPPEITYGVTGEATESYFKDNSTPDPKPVVNSAGDAFESFPQRDADGDFLLTIVVNEATFNPPLLAPFNNTVNDAPVYIDHTTYDEGTLKLSPPTATKMTERVQGEGGLFEDFSYYKVTYVVKVRPDGWDDDIADVGLNEFIPDADPNKPGKLRPIVDGTKLPVKKPWPLDGTGKKKTNPGDTPATLTFKPYKRVGWSGLKPFMPSTWGQTEA